MTLVVAFIGITRPPVWTDEAATISAADRGVSAFVDLVSTIDIVHGLYYLLMMPWIDVFGSSPLSIRTPSALVLTAGAFIAVRLTMRYAHVEAPDRAVTAGLAAGVLFAVLPGLAWMGQEARPYPFGTVCALLAWWSYERWLRTHEDRWLILLVVAHLLAIYFTLYAAMAVPLYVLRALGHGRRTALKATGAAAALGAGTLPLVLTAVPQQGQVSWISTTPLSMLQGMAAKQFFIGYGLSDGPWFEPVRVIAVILACLTLVLVLLGMVLGPLRRTQAWLWSWIAFPALVLLVVRLVGGQFYEARFLAFTAPALVVLLALVTTVCIRRRAVGLVTLGVVVVLCVPAVIGQHERTKNNSDYRSAYALLERADTIYFLDAGSRAIVTAYPQQTPAKDPMLLESPEESGSLYGRNRLLDVALQGSPSGTTAVVTQRADREGQGDNHDAVVDRFVSTGCTVQASLEDAYNRSTLLECPAP
ncbi:hypothetical protein MRU69_13790 [Kocuria flava]|uniref:glycosyltransferase family 39 protein n=1 Tax=Kocuria flava TaxID=446860 RepID=UPI001FF172D8|nr:hypothetical protein [Kocuria flava]MCJ8505913.1 hypothetical protein [Kocuria flava]